jgi:hypothetical protein
MPTAVPRDVEQLRPRQTTITAEPWQDAYPPEDVRLPLQRYSIVTSPSPSGWQLLRHAAAGS